MRNNVLPAGGGSQIIGLDKAIETKLNQLGGGKVTKVGEPIYAVPLRRATAKAQGSATAHSSFRLGTRFRAWQHSWRSSRLGVVPFFTTARPRIQLL